MEANRAMKSIRMRLNARRMRTDQRGQDLIEYALLAGFLVVAVYVILPSDLMPAGSGIFSKITAVASTLTSH